MLLTRRRFIFISAAAAGLPLRAAHARHGAGDPAAPRVWRGVALGADATLQLNHPDPGEADRLIERSLAEVRRLEAIFSLYREDSAIRRLNATRSLDAPPQDLVRILSESEQLSRATGGAFDVTVQPLWELYAAHFGRKNADGGGPHPDAIRTVLARVGQDGMEYSARRIGFRRAGMGITLNGIAQGYITDRVAELLLACGLQNALIHMGETRALGERPGGGAWRIGMEEPQAPGEADEVLTLTNKAISTSGGYGTQFDAQGRFTHIFDPRTGSARSLYRRVSVVAASATVADALSTAFCLMPLAQIQHVAAQYEAKVHLLLPDGRTMTLGA